MIGTNTDDPNGSPNTNHCTLITHIGLDITTTQLTQEIDILVMFHWLMI